MATSTSLVTGVDFIVVPTRNFDASVSSTARSFGLPCTARYGQMPGAEFETGSLTLAVMATEEFGMGSRAPTADTSVVALVVVDAENVRRSRWPNISREGLVDRAREWADARRPRSADRLRRRAARAGAGPRRVARRGRRDRRAHGAPRPSVVARQLRSRSPRAARRPPRTDHRRRVVQPNDLSSVDSSHPQLTRHARTRSQKPTYPGLTPVWHGLEMPSRPDVSVRRPTPLSHPLALIMALGPGRRAAAFDDP